MVVSPSSPTASSLPPMFHSQQSIPVFKTCTPKVAEKRPEVGGRVKAKGLDARAQWGASILHALFRSAHL